MTRAIIYVRISSDPDGTRLQVERQEKECRELADKLGWEVVDVAYHAVLHKAARVYLRGGGRTARAAL